MMRSLLVQARRLSSSRKVPQLSAAPNTLQPQSLVRASKKNRLLPLLSHPRLQQEPMVLKKYPIDGQFVDLLEWLAKGLLSVSASSRAIADGQVSAPIIRLQHQSIAAKELQREIARMTAARVRAVFVEITANQLYDTDIDGDTDANTESKTSNLSPTAISAIIAMQKQELSNGLYTINPPRSRKRRPSTTLSPTTDSDFVMFTVPALNSILERYTEECQEDGAMVVYLPDLDEICPTTKERRLFADFCDTFNRLHQSTLFMAPAYQQEASTAPPPANTGQVDPTAATLNHDFRIAAASTPANDKYGPLWTPQNHAPCQLLDRSIVVTINKPTDPRRALTLRQQLITDESLLLHEHNMNLLKAVFCDLDVDHQLEGQHIDGLSKRSKSRNELHCIAVQATGLAGGVDSTVTKEHIERVLATQPTPHLISTSEDSLVSRFAHLLAIDQLNNYERQLLRSCVTTPGTLYCYFTHCIEMLETRFKDVAGNEEVKSALDDLISKPIRHPHLFATGILKASRSGILLFGPPGTGKTMLARAVAAESGAAFIAVGPADLNSKWVGEGEKFARAVFTLARKLAPSVIFLDEIDALLESRDTASTRSSKVDILSELMSQWDGMWDVDNSSLVVMGATNRPYALDAACLRRLPRRLLVDLPEAQGRRAILEILLRDDKLDKSVDLDQLAAMTDSFSGSDLKHLCQAAALIAANRLVGASSLVISMADLRGAMERVSASVSSAAPALVKLRRWNAMYGQANSLARHGNTIGFE